VPFPRRCLSFSPHWGSLSHKLLSPFAPAPSRARAPPWQRALACRAKAQELNQLVTVHARDVGLEGLADGELVAGAGAAAAAAAPAPLVVACDLGACELVAACARCRALGIPIISGSTHGFHGFLFQDGGAARTYLHQPPAPAAAGDAAASAAPPPPAEQRVAHYRSLAEVLEGGAREACAALLGAKSRKFPPQPAVLGWLAVHAAAAGGRWALGASAPREAWVEALQREVAACCGVGWGADSQAAGAVGAAGAAGAGLAAGVPCGELVDGRGGGAEVSPVAAVVGAMVANEAMKVVTGKDAPLNNFMCFDALGGSGGRVYKL
jgi:ubiquitin-like 1-activating enzyme E1 A